METSYGLDPEFNGSGMALLPMYANSTDRHVIDLTRQGHELLAAAVTERMNSDNSRTHHYALTRFDSNGSIDTSFGKPGNNGIVFGLFKLSSDSGCISIATDNTDSSPIWMLGWSSEHRNAPKRLLIAKFDRDAKADPDQRYLPRPEQSSLQVEPPRWKAEAVANLGLQNGRSSLLIHEGHLIATANFEDQEIPPRLYRQGFEGEPGFGESSYIEVTHSAGKVTLTGLAISNGALLICGYVSKVTESGFIARYRTDGTLDTTFGEGGTLTFQIDNESRHAVLYNTRVQHLCIHSTGKILAAGSRRNGLEGEPDGWVWQFSEAGQPDETFNSGNARIAQRDNGGIEWKAGFIEQDGGAIVFGVGLRDKLHLQRYDNVGAPDPVTLPPNEIREATNAMISFGQDTKILLAANTSGIGVYTGRVIRLLRY